MQQPFLELEPILRLCQNNRITRRPQRTTADIYEHRTQSKLTPVPVFGSGLSLNTNYAAAYRYMIGGQADILNPFFFAHIINLLSHSSLKKR